MTLQHLRIVLIGTSLLVLAACGGGGGGERVASIPPPPPTPTPTPTPGSSPLPPPHLGLVSSAPFAVLAVGDSYTTDADGNHPVAASQPTAQNVQFSFDAATNTYQISLPHFQSGRLANTGYSGSAGQVATSTTSQVTAGSSATLQPVFVTMPVPGSSYSPYTYTSLGSWDGKTGQTVDGRISRDEGTFAYGIPTAPGDVPTNGSASYSAQISATANLNSFTVTGSASLLFDFGAGTLSGSMHPVINDWFDGAHVDFGQYDFTETVYSTGSTSFSGKFSVGGVPSAGSFFDGRFTGPNAAELMARFEAPYALGSAPPAFLGTGQSGTLSGVWIGKKN